MATFFEQVQDNFHHITVLTDTHLFSSGLRTAKRDIALAEINAGEDPRRALAKGAPLGQAVHEIRLSQIDKMEWHQDDTDLAVFHNDSSGAKVKKARLTLPGVDARAQLVSEIESRCEVTFSQTESEASVWHMGIMPLVLSAMTLVFTGLLAAAGWGGQVDADNMIRGRDRALGDLVNAVGSYGIMAIGGTIVAAMMIWWFIACRHRAVKVTALREAA